MSFLERRPRHNSFLGPAESALRVKKLRVDSNAEHNLSIYFETQEQNYLVVIVIHDHNNISTLENELILQWLDFGCISKIVSRRSFVSKCQSLMYKVHKVQGPQEKDGVYLAIIHPKNQTNKNISFITQPFEDTLINARILFTTSNQERHIIIIGLTKNKTMYVINIHLCSPITTATINQVECQFIIMSLKLLQLGNVVSEEEFKNFLLEVEQSGWADVTFSTPTLRARAQNNKLAHIKVLSQQKGAEQSEEPTYTTITDSTIQSLISSHHNVDPIPLSPQHNVRSPCTPNKRSPNVQPIPSPSPRKHTAPPQQSQPSLPRVHTPVRLQTIKQAHTPQPSNGTLPLDIPPLFETDDNNSNFKSQTPPSSTIQTIQEIDSPKLTPSSSSSGINQYEGIEYVKHISQGGQAIVFEGIRKGKQKVAVKVFKDLNGHGNYHREAFKTELSMFLKLSDHKNVVKVIDFFEYPEPAIIMEYIEGQSLFNFLKQYYDSNSKLTQKQGIQICIGVAHGLCHLHQQGIIHRDLKTANIMMRNDGTPVIIDFGISSILSKPPSTSNDQTFFCEQTSTIKGTLNWMAPEMISKQLWSERTDVYGFGILMWSIFANKLPYLECQNNPRVSRFELMGEICKGERPPMRDIDHIAKIIKVIIEKCWDQDARKRPAMKKVLTVLLKRDPCSLFYIADHDHNGYLDFREFVTAFIEYLPGKITQEQMYPIYKAHANVSGKLDISGFSEICQKYIAIT